MTCKPRPISGNEPFDAISKDYNRYCGRIIGNELPGGGGGIPINPDDNIVITFSEAVDPLTVTNIGDGTGSFEVYNNTSAAWVAGVLSTTDNVQWTFNPTSNFDWDDSITVYLTAAIESLVGGDPYTGPFEYNYQVVSEFDPATLNPIVWHDMSDASLLFTDAGVTPVASDGDAIYQANDKSGNGYNLLQSTLAARPTYRTGIQNGLSIARYDGVDDQMENTSMSETEPVTCYTVFQLPVATIDGVFVVGSGSFYGNAANEWIMNFSSSFSQFSRDTSFVAIKTVWDGATSSIEKNNIVITNGVINADTFNRIRVGNSAGLFGRLEWCEDIVFAGEITGDDDNNMWNYLSVKWGI